MLYFSPLSVTDDKQRDRNHPFSSPQCRQGKLGDVVGAAACGSKIYTLRGGWMAASRCVRCMQCLCWGFVLGRHGQFGESGLVVSKIESRN